MRCLLGALLAAQASSLRLPSSAALSRRSALAGVLAAATSIGPKAAAVASKCDTVFAGTYTDPNHPGGTREIFLNPDGLGAEGVRTSFGPYRLATVKGGGGVGEPAKFRLQALVDGDKAIIIDFTPKGGPDNFKGVYEGGEGEGIRFVRDRNKWPKVKACEDKATAEDVERTARAASAQLGSSVILIDRGS